MSNVKFKGVIPPVSIILTEKGELDREGTGRVVDYLIASDVHGLFFLGSGGEFSQMSVKQRKEVAEFAVEYVKGRVPVLIGTGSAITAEVINLSKHSQEIGADGVVIINPYYWPLSEENLYQHYADIAEAIDIPILLYNFPGLTGQDLTPELVTKLVGAYSNIVGIKDTVDTAGHIRELILKVKAVNPDFSVLCGFDDHLWNTLSLGGDGVISASGNFAPELTVGIYNAFQEKNLDEGIALLRRLAYIPLMYKLDSPFINVIKEAMKLRGVTESTHVLAPTRPLSDHKKKELEKILKKAELL
ncbi:MAG: dihydrodipicolinate synthase family protein [Bacillus sp. (in: Bacteria)]|nr:dihydrodipicolinate synthase family protein [Bacillus sp. (in: firmicutes)]